jgi:hypothetical protein
MKQSTFPIKNDKSFLETGSVACWKELIDKCLYQPRREHQFANRRVSCFLNTFQTMAFFDLTEYRNVKGQAIPPCLQELINLVNEKFKTDFNQVFINAYPDGNSGIDAHHDHESILSNNKAVIISVGATRTFRVKDKLYPDIEIDIPATSYSFICMGGDFQNEYTHEIPIEPSVKQPRYSINFRKLQVCPVYRDLYPTLTYKGICNFTSNFDGNLTSNYSLTSTYSFSSMYY